MSNSLKKYRLGLLILSGLTVSLLLVVVFQSGNIRADKQTYKAATKAGEKLDGYVSRQSKVPDSLTEAGVTGVSDAITYEKLSEERYKFCVTYKAESDNFNATDEALGLMYGGAYNDYSASQADDGEEQSYLYISPDHKKGQNCQTVKAYVYDNSDYSTDDYYNPSEIKPNLVQ